MKALHLRAQFEPLYRLRQPDSASRINLLNLHPRCAMSFLIALPELQNFQGKFDRDFIPGLGLDSILHRLITKGL